MRVFAELALKELRLVVGDEGLLSDKGAFSEFMDKVNERYGYILHIYTWYMLHLSLLVFTFPYGPAGPTPYEYCSITYPTTG